MECTVQKINGAINYTMACGGSIYKGKIKLARQLKLDDISDIVLSSLITKEYLVDAFNAAVSAGVTHDILCMRTYNTEGGNNQWIVLLRDQFGSFDIGPAPGGLTISISKFIDKFELYVDDDDSCYCTAKDISSLRRMYETIGVSKKYDTAASEPHAKDCPIKLQECDPSTEWSKRYISFTEFIKKLYPSKADLIIDYLQSDKVLSGEIGGDIDG